MGPGDAGVFADVLELPAPERTAEAWDALAAYLERHPVDAIVAQSEPALLLGALAARAFGLRGPSVEAALATVNKHQCRVLLRDAGLPQPQFVLGRSADDVRAFARRFGWPVVLKAVASSRQRLVTLVRTPAAVDGAVAALLAGLPRSKDVQRLTRFARLAVKTELGCDPLADFLIESFVPGAPLECDGVVTKGVVRSLGVCEQVPAAGPDFFIDGYMLPADRPAPELIRLERATAAALRALGLADTGYSVEFRMNGDAFALIEVNGRLGWDEGLGELFQFACGRFPAEIALRVALGRRIGALRPKRAAAVHYASWFEAGTVERAPGPDALRRASSKGVRCFTSVAPGDVVLPAHDPESRPHLVHAVAVDRRSSSAAYERARSAVLGLDLSVRHANRPSSRVLVPHIAGDDAIANPPPTVAR